VFTENKFVMVAFGACSVIVIVRVTYTLLVLVSQMYYVPGVPFSPFPYLFHALMYLNGTLLLILLVLNLVTSVYFAVVWRDFGWKMYKTVGANKELIGAAVACFLLVGNACVGLTPQAQRSSATTSCS
jgi:hypothetical protein